jgi:hypothetical protein
MSYRLEKNLRNYRMNTVLLLYLPKPKDLPLVGTVTTPDAPVVVLAGVLTGAVPAANSEV